MRKTTVNSFVKGMNKDSAKTVQSKDTYLHAENMRLSTDDDGQSFGGMINIKGNERFKSLDTTSNVFTFELGGTAPYNVTVTVDGNDYVYNITETEVEDQVNQLVDFLNADFQLVNPLEYVAAPFSCNEVYLTGLLGTTITLTSVSPEITNITEIIPVLTDLSVIGSVNIREDIYLFSTGNVGDGQIWKLEYDKLADEVTTTLLYNNLMNLSTSHLIEGVGRYENECVQKLYWTDNFNPVRFFNVAEENTFVNTLDTLGLNTLIDHSLVVPTDVIAGGVLLSGVYQLSYRLKATNGGESTFSVPSNMLNIVTADEEEYHTFVGENSGNNSGKAICFEINDIDTDYDLIEVVAIYYPDEFSEPIITIFAEEPIPSTGFLEGCYTGTENNLIDITADEFGAFTNPFTHAKTLASKDNRLFAGNVRKEPLALDFDARAYGHLQSSTTFNVDGAAETDFSNILDDANAINDDFYLNRFKQSSTLYGGTGTYVEYEIKTRQILADERTIGVSTSVNEEVPVRNVDNLNSDEVIGDYTYPAYNIQGMRFPNTFGLLKGYQRDEIYRFAIVFYDKSGNADFAQWIGDIKIPMSYDPNRIAYGSGDGYINGDFDGKLMRRVSNEAFLNIPYIEFTVNLPQSVQDQVSGYSIVRVERTEGNKTIVGQGLAHPTSRTYTIDDSPDVRTPIGDVEDGNTLTFAVPNSVGGLSWDAAPHFDNDAGFRVFNALGTNIKSNYVTADESRPYYATITMPEHLFCDNISLRAGDQIKTVDTYASGQLGTRDDNWKPNPGTDDFSITLMKYYTNDYGGPTSVYTTNIASDIDYLYKLPKGGTGQGSITLSDGSIFRNEVLNFYRSSSPGTGAGGSNVPVHAGYGANTILVELDQGNSIYSDLEVAGGINDSANGATAYIVNYYRPLLKQYGGNTFSQRSTNTYISTNHYKNVGCNTPNINTFDVYGGDIFMGVMEQQKVIKAWENDGSFDANHSKSAIVEWFPVESTVNVDFRHGDFFNKDGLNDNGTDVDLGEDYLYNKTFSRESTLRTFFPKPIDFQDKSEFDTRVYASEVKINGETTDSWTSFPVNQFIDVEGLYGPLNKLNIFNDTMLFYQDCGFGIISVNPRSLIQDADGFNLELGAGGVLHDFNYVSTQIGCKHQWGIITGKNAVYWLDINSKKFYRFTGQTTDPLSDIKGMFSYFCKNLNGKVCLTDKEGGDNPYLKAGINGYYDIKNNEAVFTFHGVQNTKLYTVNTTYYPGDIVESFLNPGDTYLIHTQFTSAIAIFTDDALINNGTLLPDFTNKYTVCFSEFANAFSSFYSFESPLYVVNKNLILSINPDAQDDLHRHNVGNFGVFYDIFNPYKSSVKFITNEAPLHTKTFDNVEWHTEVTDDNGDVLFNTFDTVIHNTDHQVTNLKTLDPLVAKNVKRKERTWKTDIPRSTKNRERLRDKYMESEYTFDNSNNYRLVLHYIKNLFRISHR